jgi:hypothetical protein
MAIEHAELGERERAVSAAQAAVEMLQTRADPHGPVLSSYLDRYRGSASVTPVDPGPPATGPGLLRMALSVAKAMGRSIGAGFKTVPEETRRRRLDLCAACRHYTGLRCRVCGCFTDLKSRLAHEDCPIGKWPRSPVR